MTAEGFGGNLKALQLLRGQNRGFLLTRFQSQNSGTIGSHQTSNIRTNNIFVQQQLHRTQYRIIVESTTLHHNIGP